MEYGIVIDIETNGYLKKRKRYFDDNNREIPESMIPVGKEYLYRSDEVLADNLAILSVGYLRVDLDTNKIFDAGTLYFYKPEFVIENDAQKVHGLTREFLSQYEDQFDDNIAMLEALITNAVIIGKNSDKFDIPFIAAFLQKHRGDGTLYSFINSLGMKNYDKKKLVLESTTSSYDVEVKFASMYRALMQRVHNVEISAKKRGTLTDYLNLLDADRTGVTAVLKEAEPFMREEYQARAHDAFYDVAATWLVYKFCKEIGL